MISSGRLCSGCDISLIRFGVSFHTWTTVAVKKAAKQPAVYPAQCNAAHAMAAAKTKGI